VDCRALSTGTSTNLTAGEALRFDTPPTDVSPAGRLELDLQGGTDEEPLGQWRARVVQRFRIAVQGGTRSDYEAWIIEALDTVRLVAFVYPNKPTNGSVSVCGLRSGSGATRALTAAERDAIAAYLETRRPISDRVIVLVTLPTLVHVDLRLSVLGSAAFDWDDSPGYTVTSYDPGTAQLVVSPNLPPELAPGDLLTVARVTPGVSGSDGHPAAVSAIVNTTTCVLAPFGGRSQPLVWTPAPGDPIYASSRTAYAVRRAVLAGYSIGCGSGAVPQPGMDTIGPANPGQVYGDWLADLQRDRLAAAAESVAGVTNCTVVAPATDQVATEYPFPDDAEVEFFIPGQVLVRSA
jgi:Baseplate J-like protein